MNPRARRAGHGHHGPAPFPSLFLERMVAQLGDEYPTFVDALHDEPPVSLRVNPLRPFAPEGEPVPWCTTGRYLAQRPSFTLDPRFHAGAYYVQEASSMFLEQAVRAMPGIMDRPIVALDLCAAPGGKSTHLRTLLPEGSLLVANEPIPARRAVLQENLWKWGWPDILITGMRPEELRRTGMLYDLVLVDAPCSGEGLMRRDPFARQQWSPALVHQCASLQRAILAEAWNMLAPGGFLLYSTCTWSTTENEEQVQWLMDEWHAHPIPMPDLQWTGLLQGPLGARCLPHRVRGEGFFFAALREPREHGDTEPVDHAAGVDRGGWYNALGQGEHRATRGIPLIQEGPSGPMPHAASAYSPAMHDMLQRRIPFTTLDLSENEALAFLRGEVLRLGPAAGWALATHQGSPLGWLKGAGNRWNNHLPPAWRIRKR